MAEGNSSGYVPKFVGHYDHWAEMMENLLRSKEYWMVVEHGTEVKIGGETPLLSSIVAETHKLTDAQLKKAQEDNNLKDLKAKNLLYQAIEREVLETILDRSSARAIWNSMKQKFQGSTRVKRAQLQSLRCDFEVLRMKEGETVNAYFSRVLSIANRMKAHGENLNETMITEKILRSMTQKFNYVVCSIEESNNMTTMTIDELQSSLLVHEQRMKNQVEEEQVLKVTYEERPGRGRGRVSWRGGRGRGRQSFNKATVECYKCHKLGHFQYECPSWQKNANYAEVEEEEELLLMAYVQEKLTDQDDGWFLDSGCSNHMTGNKSWFIEMDEKFRRTVKLGNGEKIMVMGKGIIRLKIEGLTQRIKDVFFIPELKNSLLSIGQLQERGLAIVIKDNCCKIYHPETGLIMQTIMTANRMFILQATMIPQSIIYLKTSEEESADLWHRRYGHVGNKSLEVLGNKQLVRGLPSLQANGGICTVCHRGKQHRTNIPKKSQWRASRRLQLIHADLCGPITPTSSSYKRYILCLIDDFSRKGWIYLLAEKSEAFSMFKVFKSYVEKEVESEICCLRTDRGGEFTSKEFNDFCVKNGIKRQLTAAYTPQQNGVAERKNRTLLNMVRCLLAEMKMPKLFWPEAAKWGIHVLNRSPTVALKEMTPEECWSGVKPNVDYFRVFGCVAHVHVLDRGRTKLDERSHECVFVGVSEETKAYRLYDPKINRVIVSRDVVCDESVGWDWEISDDNVRNDVFSWVDDLNGEISDYDEEFMEEDRDGTGLEPRDATGLEPRDKTELEPRVATLEIEDDGQIPEYAHSLGNVLEQIDNEFSEMTGNDVVDETKGRLRKTPRWMDDYVQEAVVDEEDACFMVTDDPVYFEEAVTQKKWRDAMDLEIEAIEKNKTWELVNPPNGVKKIGVKWIYKTKLNEKGEVDKCKERLVVKGYAQRYGIDYSEVFAPVARWDTIRLLLAVAAQRGWVVFQLDVKSAFLNGELTEAVYVEQPEGYVRKKEEHKVLKLRKALYGLKQAPRAWYSKIESFFIRNGFEKCSHEHTLFLKHEGEGKCLIISLYVDDLIYTGNNVKMCEEFKQSMMLEFDMSDLGKMKYFLGVEVKQSSEGIYLCQSKYAGEILDRFGMGTCNPVKNPIVPDTKLVKNGGEISENPTIFKQIIGSLMYLSVTRPDIVFVVCLLSKFMTDPKSSHMAAAKRVLRYVMGTKDLGVFYRRNAGGTENELEVYTDSDYAGDVEDRRSTSEYVFLLSGGAVAWSSKKQPIVTLSTTEAEYVAAAACACHSIWMKRILDSIGSFTCTSVKIHCDNSSTIKLSKNPILHGRTKHIDVKFHFLRELVKEGTVELIFCGTKEQIADIMTKPLKLESFVKMRSMLGVQGMEDLN